MAYPMFCLDCHKTAMPDKKMPGSILLEAGLWVAGLGVGFFATWWAIMPPIVWTIVRVVCRHSVCHHCQSIRLVYPDSAQAVAIKNERRAAESAAAASPPNPS